MSRASPSLRKAFCGSERPLGGAGEALAAGMGQFCLPSSLGTGPSGPQAHAHLLPGRFRFRPAPRTDRPAPRRRTQRLAPARWHRRRRRSTASSASCPSLLRAGDLLVFNDTQVVKARLFGEKPTGGKLELLVERVLPGHEVVAHMKVSKKPPVGTVLAMHGGFTATLLGRWPDEDGPLFRFAFSDDAVRADGAPRPRAAAALHRRTPTRPRTRAATRPCSRAHPARSPRRRPRCTSTRRVLADARGARRRSAPASRCTSAPAPSSR